MRASYAIAVLSLVLLQACANAVTYHHSERLSVAALEAKATDASQPVQGNVGAKIRTVLVTPSAGGIGATGEAMNVISDFSMARKKGGSAVFGKTYIKSAFITGKAAKEAPTESAAVIGGANIGADPLGVLATERWKLLGSAYEMLQTLGGTSAEAMAHLLRLDALARQLPDENVLASIQHYPMADLDPLVRKTESGIKLEGAGFVRVLDYELKLRNAESGMRGMLERRDQAVKVDGKELDSAALALLVEDLTRVQQRRREFASSVGSSAALKEALDYLIQGR